MLTVVGAVRAGQGPAKTGPAQPAAKAPTLADLQSRVDELQKRVDALENPALTDIRRELKTVSNDLAEAKRTAREPAAAGSAPKAAWVALGIVGGLFVLAWARVSVLREGSRRQEAITNAVVKLAEKASQETAKAALQTLMTDLGAFAKTVGSLSWFEKLRRFMQI